MGKIVAIVSTETDITSGGTPVFFVNNKSELETTSTKLEKILNASAHSISQDIMIIVDHHSS